MRMKVHLVSLHHGAGSLSTTSYSSGLCLASLSPPGARRGRVLCQIRVLGPRRGLGLDPNLDLCCCLLCSCRAAGLAISLVG